MRQSHIQPQYKVRYAVRGRQIIFSVSLKTEGLLEIGRSQKNIQQYFSLISQYGEIKIYLRIKGLRNKKILRNHQAILYPVGSYVETYELTLGYLDPRHCLTFSVSSEDSSFSVLSLNIEVPQIPISAPFIHTQDFNSYKYQ